MPLDPPSTSQLAAEHKIDTLITEGLGVAFPAGQFRVSISGRMVYARDVGVYDPATDPRPIDASTCFDLASVSKLFTSVVFMRLVEQRRVKLDDPLCSILPGFTGQRPICAQVDPLGHAALIEIVPPTDARVDASRITFRQLFSHSSGLPSWMPLWKQAQAASTAGLPPAAIQAQLRQTAIETNFAFPPGSRVVYSDIGFMLAGWAIEAMTDLRLDQAVRAYVTAPLELQSIRHGSLAPEFCAPTEHYAHQNRRMRGEVHDENAWAQHGIAGHAGLFGTADDVWRFGEHLRQCGRYGGLLQVDTLREMTKLQAEFDDVRRGIGFSLRSPNPNAMSHAFGQSVFGHLGFTGTALWVDPARDMTVACLTNHIYYGRAGADTMTPFRAKFAAACAALTHA